MECNSQETDQKFMTFEGVSMAGGKMWPVFLFLASRFLEIGEIRRSVGLLYLSTTDKHATHKLFVPVST